MSATLTETQEQERLRLMGELRDMHALMKAMCRAEDWDRMSAYAAECSRLAHLLDLNSEQ